MHGDNIRKAIKKAQHGNEVRKGVNEYGKTAWNSWMAKEYPMENAMKTDKDTKHVLKSDATPGKTVKEQVKKTKRENKSAEAYNSRYEMTNRRRKYPFNRSFGPDSTVPSVSFNHNWGKRRDGSSGPI